MGTLEDIKQGFGNHAVPPLLVQLCEFWDAQSSYFSGTFSVEADLYEGAQAWFMDNVEAAAEVLIFGTDGLGSLIGLWIHEERNTSEAPVVYLSGELEGTTVLARSLEDFLAILGTNRDYDPLSGVFLEADDQTAEAAQGFRETFLRPRGLLEITDPMVLVKAARKAVPGFPAWLEQVLG